MRRLVLSIALAVSLSALHASPAPAQRHHRAAKGTPGGAQNAPIVRVTFGFAILKKVTVTGEIALTRMAPNTIYEITVFESPALTRPWTPIVAGALTTNNVGNGNLAINAQRIPGSTTFFVAAVPQGHGQTYDSSAVELD
jgi:hypothetical protein